MNKNKQIIQNRKGRHLTYGKRCKIEALLAISEELENETLRKKHMTFKQTAENYIDIKKNRIP